MNWEHAHNNILSLIRKGLSINTINSSCRTVLEVPPYKCKQYNQSEGFKVNIGKESNVTIDIPLSMLKGIYENAIKNNRIYENKVFVKLYPNEQKIHPCHVHVVGQIFVKAKIAIEISTRKYKII